MNKQNKTDTDSQIQTHTGGCQRGVGGGKMGKISEGDQEAQMSSYKISQSWGCNVQNREYSQ